jgi:hypothetical protein
MSVWICDRVYTANMTQSHGVRNFLLSKKFLTPRDCDMLAVYPISHIHTSITSIHLAHVKLIHHPYISHHRVTRPHHVATHTHPSPPLQPPHYTHTYITTHPHADLPTRSITPHTPTHTCLHTFHHTAYRPPHFLYTPPRTIHPQRNADDIDRINPKIDPNIDQQPTMTQPRNDQDMYGTFWILPM